MTPSELHRQLLFYGYDEVTDFLSDSPLNRHIYKLLLDLLPKANIEVPLVRIFNEIYFQCVRVNYDAQPGLDVSQRYVNECAAWLNSKPAAEVVFSAVWAIFKNKRINFEEECFLDQITPYVKRGNFFRFADQLASDLHWITVPNQIPARTCSVDFLPQFLTGEDRRNTLAGMISEITGEPEDYEAQLEELREYQKAWRTVTCNFSHSVIEKYVRLYSGMLDQMKMVARIEDAFVRDEIYTHVDFIKELYEKIKTGAIGTDVSTSTRSVGILEMSEEEFEEYRHKLGLDKNEVDGEKEDIEELKRQCDEAVHKVEAMQESHAVEVKDLEAEIARLKVQLAKKAKPKTTKKATPAVAQPVVSITIDEMIDFVKKQFSEQSAKDFSLMLLSLATDKHYHDDGFISLVKSIPAAIEQRKNLHQTVNIKEPTNVYLNPKVDNNYHGTNPQQK